MKSSNFYSKSHTLSRLLCYIVFTLLILLTHRFVAPIRIFRQHWAVGCAFGFCLFALLLVVVVVLNLIWRSTIARPLSRFRAFDADTDFYYHCCDVGQRFSIIKSQCISAFLLWLVGLFIAFVSSLLGIQSIVGAVLGYVFCGWILLCLLPIFTTLVFSRGIPADIRGSYAPSIAARCIQLFFYFLLILTVT